MKGANRIVLFIVLILVFFIGYLLIVQSPKDVQAPSDFQGPTRAPSVEGPGGPPPGQ